MIYLDSYFLFRGLDMSINKDELLKRIGHRLKVLRANSGLKQTELQDKTGIDQANISSYERGVKPFSIVDLFKLAEGLGCKVTDIVDIDKALA